MVICAAGAIALGTYAGGWRIIRTVGMRIIQMDTAQGFAAEAAGAVVILLSSHFGYPLSSTHVISGGVIGAGAAKRLSAVRWGVAGKIAAAWVLTLPAAGLLGAAAYALASSFGTGVLGPLLISLVALTALSMALAGHRRQHGAGRRRLTRAPRRCARGPERRAQPPVGVWAGRVPRCTLICLVSPLRRIVIVTVCPGA